MFFHHHFYYFIFLLLFFFCALALLFLHQVEYIYLNCDSSFSFAALYHGQDIYHAIFTLIIINSGTHVLPLFAKGYCRINRNAFIFSRCPAPFLLVECLGAFFRRHRRVLISSPRCGAYLHHKQHIFISINIYISDLEKCIAHLHKRSNAWPLLHTIEYAYFICIYISHGKYMLIYWNESIPEKHPAVIKMKSHKFSTKIATQCN